MFYQIVNKDLNPLFSEFIEETKPMEDVINMIYRYGDPILSGFFNSKEVVIDIVSIINKHSNNRNSILDDFVVGRDLAEDIVNDLNERKIQGGPYSILKAPNKRMRGLRIANYYRNNKKEEFLPSFSYPNSSKPVIKLTTSGKEVDTFSSIREASRKECVSTTAISRNLKKETKTCNGHVFRLKHEIQGEK